MEIFKKHKNIVIGLTLLFVGFIIYNNFIKEEDVNDVKEVIVSEGDKESRNILNVLEKIDKIDLNPKFFNQVSTGKGYNLTFSELVDFPIEENNKLPGKINPFILNGSIERVDPEDTQINGEDDNSSVQEELVKSL